MTAESNSPLPDATEPEPVMSVCGSPTEAIEGDENEATSSYLFRVLFGACTSGAAPPSTAKRSSSGGNVGGNASLSSLRHQPTSLKKSLRHAMVDAEGIGNNQDGGIVPADAGLAPGAAAAAASKRRSESRARARNVQPPPEIESGPSPMTTKSKSKKSDLNRNASSSNQQPGNNKSATPFAATAAAAAAMEESSPDSPYHVSEVPRPLPAESMDEADDVSYCFDDGISAISAHTLEEMARLNPVSPSRRSKRSAAMDEPEEEGFDISIKDNGTGNGTSSNNMADSNSNSNNNGQSKTSAPNELKSSSTNPHHKLSSTPRAANGDGSHGIHNVDESGDGVGALPAHGPDRFDRMRSTNTRTSRTTATSASSDFENRFRRDEAAFWDEEARKAKSSAGDVPATQSPTDGTDGAVDENGFPIVVDQFPSSMSKLSSGKSLTSKTTATTRKKLHDRTRSSDLTAPTANMTMHTAGSSSNLTDSHYMTENSFLSQSSRHPHDTTPFDISDSISQAPTSPMGSPSCTMEDDEAGDSLTSRRRASRKQRLHDSLVRKGLMMMKGGAKLPSEVHESPASEIFISAPEVGEI